ncbi:MAG: hypothetical protein NW218_12255 [Saprospiraceae bacterium]|nr:hypothetical protein [Saprospiraceae bacterium]
MKKSTPNITPVAHNQSSLVGTIPHSKFNDIGQNPKSLPNVLGFHHYNDLQGFASVIHTTTLFILAGKQIRTLISGLSNILLSTLLLIVCIPLGILIYLFLNYQVWKLKRYALADFQFDLSNYKKYRQQFDKISAEVDKLRPLTNVKSNQIEWYARPFLKLAIKAINIVIGHHTLLALKMEKLDTPPSDLPKGWRVVSGEELWQSRPSKYEYVI